MWPAFLERTVLCVEAWKRLSLSSSYSGAQKISGVDMDTAMQRAGNPKAMAKSKRNSSQRQQQRASFSHTKRHPLPSQRQARPENDVGGGPDDKTLPSNWDSNEALPLSDSDAEELAKVAEEPEQQIDVKPKSRGADYNYLLTQDLIPLHHNVPELRGMSALLAASGLDSLAWNVCGTEQVHKGGQATIDTAALLSVNLRALGESLAALSLSQRLFIEEEILTAQPELLKKEKFVIDNKKPSFKVKPDVVLDSTSQPEASSRPASAVSWNASLAGIETSALESLSALSIKDTLSDCPESTSGTKKEVFVDSSTLSAAESLFALSNDNTFPMKYERKEPENLSGVSHTETVKVKFDAQTAETELDALLDMLDAPPPPTNSGKGMTMPRDFSQSQDAFNLYFSEPSHVPIQPDIASQGLAEDHAQQRNYVNQTLDLRSNSVGPFFQSQTTARGLTADRPQVLLEDDFDAWLDSIDTKTAKPS